jgi:hypothetical protein
MSVDGKVILNGKYEIILKTVVCLKTLYLYAARKTDKNHKNLSKASDATGTSCVQVQNVTFRHLSSRCLLVWDIV